MENLFVNLYLYFTKHRSVFFITLLLSFGIVGWFASRVHFEEDITKVLPKDKKIEKLNEVFQNSRFAERLVLMVSPKDSTAPADPDSLVAFADEFSARLRRDLSPYIGRLADKVDDSLTMSLFNTIGDHLPVYLDEADYAAIDTLNVPRTLRSDYNTLVGPAGFALKGMISRDPSGMVLLGLKKLQGLQYDDNFELYNEHIVTKDHRTLMLFLTPAYPVGNTGKNALLIKGIDEIVDSLTGKTGPSAATGHSGSGVAGLSAATGDSGAPSVYPNLSLSYFGAVAVSVGNALQLRQDTLFTQGITILFLLVFIGYYFGKKRAPFIILVPVLFGSLFSLAVVYLIKGGISVIALGGGSIILGVAVNYSLHLYNHYRHIRDIPQVLRDLAMPLTVGGFTTIGGFLCLEFVESEMLKDLGLFAAFSLVGASLATLIFLPHLLPAPGGARKARAESGGKEGDVPPERLTLIELLAARHPEYNRYLLFTILVGTLVFGYTAQNVGFESDLGKMNYVSSKLQQAENQLKRVSVFSLQSVFLVTEGRNLNEALERSEHLVGRLRQMERQGLVKKYSGVSSLILSDSLQRVKIDRWNQFWTKGRQDSLVEAMRKDGAALGFRPQAFDRFDTLLHQRFQPVDTGVMNLVRHSYLEDYITENPGKTTVVTMVKVSPEGKQAVYKAFSEDPDVTVLDRQYLASTFVGLINNDFMSIAWMSSILVFVVLLLTYGRIELTLVSFIPMFVTFLWILGIMGLLNIRFNIVNIILSAFIFGMGDDYSLFIMDGLLQEYKTGRENLASFKSAIILSAITTVAGLGVLIFARHPALRSIAVISIVGMGCVVLLSQILIPFLFNFLIRNRVKKGWAPLTLSGLLRSVFAFLYFGIGSILLTIAGLILIKARIIGKERGKYVFHWLISWSCRSLVYIMVNVRKRTINPLHEDFSKPAVIVCNHQSELDIVFLIMQHPKLILSTNQRIWKSRILGGLIRMADYIPIVEGTENNMDVIRERVRNGYSVVIFPEGTRSRDGRIGRFHKGAFYLAEKLGLDILPLMLHGTDYTMTVGDFLIKSGRVTLEYLPRIPVGDGRYGETYSERAKAIGRHFRAEYAAFRERCEQPRYFRNKLFYNYLYKGPVLEWYMRVKVAMEKDYQVFHDLLPKTGHLLDIGCGYGFMSYVLRFAAGGRVVTGIDYDEDKIATAARCVSRDESISFFHADALDFPMADYDGIILADMLHYLPSEAQRVLVNRCIDHLRPGGVILLRDADTSLAARHQGTRWTEFWSTRVFVFNKTRAEGLTFFSSAKIREIASERGMTFDVIDNTKYTSNLIYVIRHDGNPL